MVVGFALVVTNKSFINYLLAGIAARSVNTPFTTFLAAGIVPVFGILERNGKVQVSVVPDVTAQPLIGLTVQPVRRGSIIYTEKIRIYDSLMFCRYRHLKIDHTKRFSSGKVYINRLEGFWSWAKERLIKHHGVSKENFFLCLKEHEFRYYHRHTDIFDIVADYLCDLVPGLN